MELRLLRVDEIELQDAQNREPKKRPATPVKSLRLFITK
jgi:hypothetical protein